MARRGCFMATSLAFFTAMMQLGASSLSKVMPQTNRSTGIFLLIDGGKYTLNFTEATAACLFLNVTMATKDQMEEAVQHGLETCKYGWVAEKMAVIPRITPDPKCGAGKTGLVQWNAPLEQRFAVFCFNVSALSDQTLTLNPTTTSPKSSRFSTLPGTLTPTFGSAAPTFRTPTQPPPTKQAPSASAPLTEKTEWSFSSSYSVKDMPSHIPLSPRHHITSIPSVVTFSLPTSAQLSSSPVSSKPTLQESDSSPNPLLDAVHIALISLSIILLLLVAATVWWCFKSNVVRWYVWRRKDDVEMWRSGHGDLELCNKGGGETEHHEDMSTKRSSDVPLFVNPCTETNSSE